MRSLLVAAAVLGLAIAALASSSVFAGPPPESGPRDVKLIIEALKKKPAMKGELASVRFLSEVLGETTLDVPVGSSPETLGPWSDNVALLRSELLIGGFDRMFPANNSSKSHSSEIRPAESGAPSSSRIA